jgi:uncharacterized membrane protein
MAAAPPPRPLPSGLVALGRSLAINLLGPYLVYRAVEGHFPARSLAPLLISALVPIGEFAWLFARKRMVDAIAIIAIAQLTASLVIAVATHSLMAGMVGNALQAAAVGVVFAASVLVGRPLITPLARMTMAGDDPQRQARFDAMAVLPGARRSFVLITLAWTVALCLESAVLLLALRMLAVHDYLLFANALSLGVKGALIWGSIAYGRAAVRRAASRQEKGGAREGSAHPLPGSGAA